MSASSNPTRKPCFAKLTARFTATVVLPTPPLPDPTATTCCTPGSGCGPIGCCPVCPICLLSAVYCLALLSALTHATRATDSPANSCAVEPRRCASLAGVQHPQSGASGAPSPAPPAAPRFGSHSHRPPQ